MPMEGQWRRSNTPLYKLTRRERVAAMIVGALALVAVAALLLAGSGTSRPAPGPGCIRATVPGVMGALEVNACGERARNLCAKRRGETDPGSQAIENACREARVGA